MITFVKVVMLLQSLVYGMNMATYDDAQTVLYAVVALFLYCSMFQGARYSPSKHMLRLGPSPRPERPSHPPVSSGRPNAPVRRSDCRPRHPA